MQTSGQAAGTDNFYPRPPRGGRRNESGCRVTHWMISIHALREEGDVGDDEPFARCIVFLSTPSARRATGPLPPFSTTDLYFYPRPP